MQHKLSLVCVVAFLWVAWSSTAGEDVPDRINAVSTVAQAVSAILIVGLSALAYTAFDALRVGRHEARTAGEAVEETRRSNLLVVR